MKEIPDFNVLEIFSPYEHFSATLIKKNKKTISLACIHEDIYTVIRESTSNTDVLPDHQSFLRRVGEMSLTWSLLASVFERRCKHDSFSSKQNPCY